MAMGMSSCANHDRGHEHGMPPYRVHQIVANRRFAGIPGNRAARGECVTIALSNGGKTWQIAPALAAGVHVVPASAMPGAPGRRRHGSWHMSDA